MEQSNVEAFEAPTMCVLTVLVSTRLQTLIEQGYHIDRVSNALLYDGRMYYAQLIVFMTEREAIL